MLPRFHRVDEQLAKSAISRSCTDRHFYCFLTPIVPVRSSRKCTSNERRLTCYTYRISCWVIHLFRPGFDEEESSPIASQSAAAATRLFEDLLQQGRVGQGPQFTSVGTDSGCIHGLIVDNPFFTSPG